MIESKWDPMRKKFVRRLLEEQDMVLRSYFAQKGGTRSKGGDEQLQEPTCMREVRRRARIVAK